MPFDLVLRNGLIVTPTGVLHGGIAIDGEKIVDVGPSDRIGSARRTIDVEGKVIFPGLFDPHVHFGFGSLPAGDDSMAEDFLHSTRDCLIGGVTMIATTTLIASRRNTLPEMFDRALLCADANSWCDFMLTSVVGARDHVDQISAVAAKGCVDYKFYTGYAGDQAESLGLDRNGITPDLFLEACEALRRVGAPTFPKIHAEDPYVRGVLVDRLRKSGREDSLVAWAESSPEWGESLQVYTFALVANEVGVPLYPVHVSAAHTVDTIKHLHGLGLNVIGETLVGMLCTTAPEMDAKGLGGRGKTQPPIRFEKDRQRLWQAINDGTITVIGTDSATYSASMKEAPDFWDCRVGLNFQAADTLPLMFDEGINKQRTNLETLAKVLAENAAKQYGVYPKKGVIAVGSDADLVVIDPDLEGTLGSSRYRGPTDYSIWEGRKVKGMPTKTFLRGSLVMEDGEIVVDRPRGVYVKPTIGRYGFR